MELSSGITWHQHHAHKLWQEDGVAKDHAIAGLDDHACTAPGSSSDQHPVSTQHVQVDLPLPLLLLMVLLETWKQAANQALQRKPSKCQTLAGLCRPCLPFTVPGSSSKKLSMPAGHRCGMTSMPGSKVSMPQVTGSSKGLWAACRAHIVVCAVLARVAHQRVQGQIRKQGRPGVEGDFQIGAAGRREVVAGCGAGLLCSGSCRNARIRYSCHLSLHKVHYSAAGVRELFAG